MTESWTVGRLLTWTTDYLKKGGSESPRLDAEVLLAEARGCERIALYTAFAEEVPEDIRGKFKSLVKRRADGTPVAYLVGRREFFSLLLEVTPDVLVPRPETEFVVTAALDVLEARGADAGQSRVADVGAGSGAIAIAIAKHADCQVLAVDISAAALVVAKRNAERHQVSERIEFVAGNLLGSTPAEPTFDVVAANLPYIGGDERGTVESGVHKHEPHGALYAGPIGDELIAQLIPQAAERLKNAGWLILEFSPLIADRVVAALKADGRFAEPIVARDLAGHARVVRAQRK